MLEQTIQRLTKLRDLLADRIKSFDHPVYVGDLKYEFPGGDCQFIDLGIRYYPNSDVMVSCMHAICQDGVSIPGSNHVFRRVDSGLMISRGEVDVSLPDDWKDYLVTFANDRPIYIGSMRTYEYDDLPIA